MCGTHGPDPGGPGAGWLGVFGRATFADPWLEAAFWDHHKRHVLLGADRRYYAGAAAVLAVAGGVLVRDGAPWLGGVAPCAAGLALALGAAAAIGASPEQYTRHREAIASAFRVGLAALVAWICAWHFPARGDGPLSVFAAKLLARGPLAALASGWAGLQLRPGWELAVQSACLAAAIPLSGRMCETCLASPGQASLLGAAAGAMDSVGAGIMTVVDHGGDAELIDGLMAPAGDPCALLATFLLIWLGWAAPLAASWATARRARRAFLRAHLPGDWPDGLCAKPLGWGALATAIWAFNAILTVELSWRLLKWITRVAEGA